MRNEDPSVESFNPTPTQRMMFCAQAKVELSNAKRTSIEAIGTPDERPALNRAYLALLNERLWYLWYVDPFRTRFPEQWNDWAFRMEQLKSVGAVTSD